MIDTMTPDEQSLFEEETRSTIAAWKQQEKKYACHDYCRMHEHVTKSSTLEADRKLMIKWSYNVVDYFNLNRETAAIAFSYSDRFMATDKGPAFLRDTDKYQLLCIVSLYLAIKVHETSSLTPKMFVDIGHGHYRVDQIEKMERLLLDGLNWNVNPPTALGFVRLYLDLMPSLDRGMKATAYMLARAQTERAVGEYRMLTVEPSKIAFASLQNSLEALGYCDASGMMSTAPFDSSDYAKEEITKIRLRLCAAITFETSLMSLVPATTSQQKSTKTKANHTSSQESTTPRSVLCHA